jgi:hypothetical protein
MHKWRIGEVTVIKVLELETLRSAEWILPDAVPTGWRYRG